MYFKNKYADMDIDKKLVRKNYQRAIDMLKENTIYIDCYKKPVLSTGVGYQGIWLEHNHDSLFYADIDPEIAINSHKIFYDFQTKDGLFPAYIAKWDFCESCQIGYGHMQTVYPIAASALEIAKKVGDEAFLFESYIACKKYDDWIKRYRNTRKTGLCEIFCGYDTGHDNSARINDFSTVCPQGNARICEKSDILPIVAPDMSAMMYRAEIALAEMAENLGKKNEADNFLKSAQNIKEKIYEICFDKQDEFFYDVDKHGNFRKFISEQIFRLFLNHAVDQEVFDKIFDRYIFNEKYFFAKYPFASIGVSEEYFDIKNKENSWNGMTQLHTALETLFWMEHYGKGSILKEYMKMWINLLNDADMLCGQEVDPFDGHFSKSAPHFTTAIIMYVEFAKRLGLNK